MPYMRLHTRAQTHTFTLTRIHKLMRDKVFKITRQVKVAVSAGKEVSKIDFFVTKFGIDVDCPCIERIPDRIY